MSDILDRIGAVRLVPVVVIENAEDAVPLGEALMAGGLPCAEVTFRTAAAAAAIQKLSGVDGLLLGAGTVLYTPTWACRFLRWNCGPATAHRAALPRARI